MLHGTPGPGGTTYGGVELCLDTPTLDTIREDFQGAVKDCFREVLKRWLENTYPRPSWEMLATALEAAAVGYPSKSDKNNSSCTTEYASYIKM